MDVTDAPRLRISTAGAIQLGSVTAEEFRVFLKLLFPMYVLRFSCCQQYCLANDGDGMLGIQTQRL